MSNQPVAPDGGLECPATITSAEGMTVPQPPQGVDGKARLLPDRDPASLVLCSYPVLDFMTGSLTPPFKLKTRSVATAEKRKEVVELLTWAPRDNGSRKGCTEIGGNETAHLVGARYHGAVVWVAAKADPNSCSKSTNGDFVSTAAMGVQLERLVRSREPVVPPPVEVCQSGGFGRLGDHVSLAPEGDPAVTVCRYGADGQQTPTRLSAGQSRQVVSALRALRTRASSSSCINSSEDTSRDFQLILTYPQGPATWASVSPMCTPPIYSSALLAMETGDVVTLVEQWSKPIPGRDKNGSVSSDGTSSTDGGPVPPDQPQSQPPLAPGSMGGGAQDNPGTIEPPGSIGN